MRIPVRTHPAGYPLIFREMLFRQTEPLLLAFIGLQKKLNAAIRKLRLEPYIKKYSMRHRFSHWLLVKQRKSFYIVLAALLSLFFIFDQASTHLVRGMQHSTFDWLLSHRLNYKAPDRDIVIIDIDDASLSALSDRYGRWPWPRDLMAKVTTGLMQAEPKAVVFDIVFSESDRLNPDSDALFARAIAAAPNVFAPMDLLDDLDPHKTAAPNIPTAQKAVGTAQADIRLSVLKPYFASSVQASQLGTNNVEPDQDGVIRRFELFQERHGWRLSSIAEQVRQGLSVPRPEDNSILLNWRGGAFSYPFVSFSTVISMIDRGDLVYLQRTLAERSCWSDLLPPVCSIFDPRQWLKSIPELKFWQQSSIT